MEKKRNKTVLDSLTYNKTWSCFDAYFIQNGQERNIKFFSQSKTSVIKKLRNHYDVVCPKTAIHLGWLKIGLNWLICSPIETPTI